MGPCSNTRQAQGENQKTTISRQPADTRWAASSRADRNLDRYSVCRRSNHRIRAVVLQSVSFEPTRGDCTPDEHSISLQQALHLGKCSRQWGYRLEAGSAMQVEAQSRAPIQSVENVETLGDRLFRNGRNRMPARLTRRDICRAQRFRSRANEEQRTGPNMSQTLYGPAGYADKCCAAVFRGLSGSAQACSTEIEPAS